MTHSPYDQLAKQFLDMWQDQTRHMMQDKRFLDSMLDMLAQMQPGADAYRGTANAKTHTTNQPDTASSDALHAQLAELYERLERCEARLAKLEGKSKGNGKRKKTKD